MTCCHRLQHQLPQPWLSLLHQPSFNSQLFLLFFAMELDSCPIPCCRLFHHLLPIIR
jgi:hypothetical protein